MKNSKKVLHVFNSLNHSGAEIMYQVAAPLFQNQGYELHALVTNKDKGTYFEQMVSAGYIIHYYPISFNSKIQRLFVLIPYFIKIYRHFKREGYYVLHIHPQKLFWFYALAGRLAGIKKIVRTFHNVFKVKFILWPNKYISRVFTKKILKAKYTSVSQDVYNNELDYYGNATALVNNWYNQNIYYPASLEEKNAKREKLNIATGETVLISVGYCLPQKRHMDILEALKLLKEQGIEVFYIHIGSGPLESNEKEYVRANDLKNNVLYLGNISNVKDYLVASDIYLMPSEYEGVGIAAIEAIATGIPIIIYNAKGLREIMEYLDLEKYMVSKSYLALAEKVKEVIDDLEHHELLFRNVKNRLDSKYGVKNNVANLLALYES